MVRREWIARWKWLVARRLEVLSVCSAWRGHALNREEEEEKEEEEEEEEEEDDYIASMVEK